MHGVGKSVTRAIAIKWIISSYKREALIRFGANRRATDALRAQQIAGERARKQEWLTRSAVAFAHNGSTITEREAEAFFDSGISVVLQRLVCARASTYVYDKASRLFVPVAVSNGPSCNRSPGVVKAILATLSEEDCTASDIASKWGVDVNSVRCILNRMRRAGSVEPSEKRKGTGRGSAQIVWRLKEASCNLST
jgi:transposase